MFSSCNFACQIHQIHRYEFIRLHSFDVCIHVQINKLGHKRTVSPHLRFLIRALCSCKKLKAQVKKETLKRGRYHWCTYIVLKSSVGNGSKVSIRIWELTITRTAISNYKNQTCNAGFAL